MPHIGQSSVFAAASDSPAVLGLRLGWPAVSVGGDFPVVVDDSAVVAEGVAIGPFSVIGAGARIGPDTRIGGHVIVHPGTQVGAGCELQDGAVLGKPPKLARHSSAPREAPAPLEVGDGAVVCCNAVVLAGARLGAGAIVGDQAFVRERAVLGEGTVVGRGRGEDDAFAGPGVCTPNDSTMARHPVDYPVLGARLRRACRVGGGVVICPDVE